MLLVLILVGVRGEYILLSLTLGIVVGAAAAAIPELRKHCETDVKSVLFQQSA